MVLIGYKMDSNGFLLIFHQRYLVNKLGLRVTVVPWDYDFTQEDFDGLFLSNGPGDPTQCAQTVENVKCL